MKTYLEEESNNEYLKAAHSNHHDDLNQAEIDYSRLRASDSAEVSVLAGAEIFLVSGDSREKARDFVD